MKEDIYTLCANNVLEKHGRPRLPWAIKAQMMGVPGSSEGDLFHKWAQLDISREQFRDEQREQQRLHFPECKLLPGVAKLLLDLKSAHNFHGDKVHIALATSSEKRNFDLKIVRPETIEVFKVFDENRRILGDDPRLRKGIGKPSPDIFLLALQVINESLKEGEGQITPEECLVFEDSIPGVEAGRRAGMRVVWVPHPGLAAEYVGKEDVVLAGRTNLVPIGDKWQLGDVRDGWATNLSSLEDFPYAEFGIQVES